MNRIYLDHNAHSPLRPQVKEKLLTLFGRFWANPSSVHSSGRNTRALIEDARHEVALFLGREDREVIFTSSATEANHLAWHLYQKPNVRICSTNIEHPSIMAAATKAKSKGAIVSTLQFDIQGNLASIPTHEGHDFYSIQAANNETGLILPLASIFSNISPQTILHVDAVQAAGRIPLVTHPHLITLSGHKLGALAGVGALIANSQAVFEPFFEGGPQEKGLRPGTENIFGIVSMGEACQFLRLNEGHESHALEKLHREFEKTILETIPDVRIIHQHAQRLPQTSCIMFEGVKGETLLMALDLEGIDASLGAACSSGSIEPSHVLLNMGFLPQEALQCVRFSLGWNTTEEALEQSLKKIEACVLRCRGMS